MAWLQAHHRPAPTGFFAGFTIEYARNFTLLPKPHAQFLFGCCDCLIALFPQQTQSSFRPPEADHQTRQSIALAAHS
jgi:hypothetical protein